MPHEMHNMKLIGHDKLQGFPNIGEGMAIQQAAGGRRVMWLAHESSKDFTGGDVTDPGVQPFYGDHSADGMNINDVYVDENRIVYAVDRARGGLYILDLTV